MSLLPKSQQYREDILCWPLGPAKVKPVAVKVDPIREFETGIFLPPGAKVTFYQASIAIPIPTPPSTEKPPKFKEGDLVRPAYEGHWGIGRVTKTMYDTLRKCQVTYYVPEHSSHETFDEDSDLELASPSEPKADAEWVSWAGGKAPAITGLLELRYRDGVVIKGFAHECGLCWRNDNAPDDIVAYRLVKQQ